jgi:protein-tyrosine phosphatase
MHRLLFLCTGNYYRSRFAEILFNARATICGSPWLAFSRGLALPQDGRNVGPLSPFAREALAALGIASPAMERYPLAVDERDFQAANYIIALDEVEHRPYVQAHHAHWLHQIHYWHVRDQAPTPMYNPLAEIRREVEALLAQFGQ